MDAGCCERDKQFGPDRGHCLEELHRRRAGVPFDSHRSAHAIPDAHADTDARAHADPEADPDAKAEPDTGANSHSWDHTDPDTQSVAHANAGTHTDTKADPDASAEPDTRAESDPWNHADPDANSDAHSHQGAHADTAADSDSKAHPVTRADVGIWGNISLALITAAGFAIESGRCKSGRREGAASAASQTRLGQACIRVYARKRPSKSQTHGRSRFLQE
jgi:hypothetical protein